ncbi:MAG: hypothetical protein ACOWWM_13370 [Desulfobacterales bacterium]
MTGPWHSKNLGDAMFATQQLNEIESLFLSEFMMAGRPKDMALFFRHESEGRLHCEVMTYFSPAAAAVAEKVDAARCPRPSPKGLSLLAGADDCWALLFPESTD